MILESVLPAITEYVAKKVADKLFHAPRDNPEKPVKDRIKSALEVHVNRIANWSSSVGLYRMPAQKSVEIGTVPLLFSATPRRFRSAADSGKIYTEVDLLSASQHLLILGPPGAGKTTALKRIARAILTDEPTGPLDTYQVPILLRLREIDFTSVEVNPIMAALAFELGLFVKIPEERFQVELLQKDGSKKIEERVRRGAPLCENMPMQQLLPRLMDEINPILLLDGLDEVTPGARASVEKDIEILLENSGTYKVLVTCRSGEYATPINGMDVIEVCDLQTHDVKILSQQWLGDRSDLFLQKVENTSLADLSTRPLFLTHMLVLFDIEGTLPDQPFELYELIVSLMIREWDRERKIARVSKYSDFGPEKSDDFYHRWRTILPISPR